MLNICSFSLYLDTFHNPEEFLRISLMHVIKKLVLFEEAYCTNKIIIFYRIVADIVLFHTPQVFNCFFYIKKISYEEP